MRGQLTSPRAAERVTRLERLPRDRPITGLRDTAAINVPTLVIAHHQDPLHPYAFGAALACVIPEAQFVSVTSKSLNAKCHADEVQQALTLS